MRSYFYRFVALALVPAMVLADPSLASGFSHIETSKPHFSSSLNAYFSAQAVVEPLDGGYTGDHGAVVTRQAGGLYTRRQALGPLSAGIATLLFAPGAFAQKSASQTAPQPIPLDNAPELLRQTEGIAQAPAEDNLWHQGVPIPAQIDQLSDFMEAVYDNNPELAAQWLKMGSAIADWFAASAPMRVITYGTDNSRALRVDTGGPVYSDMVLYPRYQDLNAFSTYQSASTVPGQSSSWWHKIFSFWTDLVTNGGVSTTPKAMIEKNLLHVLMAGTQIRVQFADLQGEAHHGVRTFQRNLYALMGMEHRIRAKRLELHIAQKEKAEWTSEPAYNTSTGRLKPLELRHDITRLELELNKLLKEHGDLEDGLRRQLISQSNFIGDRAEFRPRPPTFNLDASTLETLANLNLPDDVQPLLHVALPSSTKLKEGLKRLPKLRTYKDDIPNDILSLGFMRILLDAAYKVPGFTQSVFEAPVDFNPRRTIKLEELVQILPDDDSTLGVSPAEASYLFQGLVMKQANDLTALDKKSTFSAGLRINLAELMPVRLELNATRVLDSTQVDMRVMSTEILRKRIPELIQAYRINIALRAWQELRQAQIQGLRDVRTLARNLIEQYQSLEQQLSLASPGKTGQSTAIIDFQTPSEEIAIAQEMLAERITALQGVLDEAYLLTPDGERAMSEGLAAHFARSMKSAELLTPTPASTPSVAPDQKHSKHTTKLRSFVVLELLMAFRFLPHINLPHLHYWQNPGLQLLTGLVIFSVMLFWDSFRREPESNWKSHLTAHVVWTVLLGFALPGNWLVTSILAAAAFVVARAKQRFMFFQNGKGTPLYRVIHWQNSHPVWVSRSMRALFIWLLVTLFWIAGPPAKWITNRQIASFSLDSKESMRISSQILTEPIYVGAPPKDSGIVTDNPGLINQNGFRAGQVIVAWKGPSDAELLRRFERIQEDFRSLGLEVSIDSLNELDTDKSDSRYQKALKRVLSDGRAGSIEARLSWVVSEIETVLPLYRTALDESNANHAAAGVSGQTSWKVDGYRAELSALKSAAEALLQQRQWRDIRAKRDFQLIPDTDRLSSGKTIDGARPISIGKQALENYAHFSFIFSPTEAATFEAFSHQRDAIVVLEEEQSGKRIYFRAQDIRTSSESADKGFLSEFYVNPGSGVIPQFRYGIDVQLPEKQTLFEGTRNYDFVGFYSAKAYANGGDPLHPSETDHLAPAVIQPGRHVALARIIPDGITFSGLEGPVKALQSEIHAYETAIQKYQDLKSKAQAVFDKHNGTRAGMTFATEARSAVEHSEARIAQLKSALDAASGELAIWQSAGLQTIGHSAADHPALPRSLRGWPANPLANSTNPLDYHYRVAPQGENTSADSQSEYILGAKTRLVMRVHASDFSELSIQPGQLLILSIPGSSQEFPVIFNKSDVVRNQEFRDRDMPASYSDIEISIATEKLSALYPQLNWGGAPTGEVFVEVRKATTAPKPAKPTSSLSPALAPAPEKTAVAAPASKFTKRLLSLGLISLFAPLQLHAESFTLHLDSHLMKSTGLRIAPAVLSVGLFFLGRWIVQKWRARTPDNLAVPKESEMASSSLNEVLLSTRKLERERTLVQRLLGSRHMDATVIADSIKHRLNPLNSYKKKMAIAKALSGALGEIQDEDLLDKMAASLEVPLADSSSPTLNIQAGISKSLAERLGKLLVVSVNTRPDDPLTDIVLNNGVSLAYIDAGLLEKLLGMLNGSDEERRIAEAALFAVFYYVLAAPVRIEKPSARNDALFAIDQTRADNFLSLADHLLTQLNNNVPVISLIETLRENRNTRTYPVSIEVSNEPTLSREGLRTLLNYWQNEPFPYELAGSGGKPLSLAEQLVRDLKNKDVMPSVAEPIAEYYTIKTRTREWSNARTSFALIMDIALTLLITTWLVWPAFLPALFRKLTLSQMTWALFIHGPKEAGVPAFALTGFVTLLVISFFLGAFKATSEPISGNWYNVRLLGFYFRYGRPQKYFEEFYRLAQKSTDKKSEIPFPVTVKYAFSVLDKVQERAPVLEGGDGEFRKLFSQQSRMITSRVYRSLMNQKTAPEAIFELKRNVVSALYSYAEHPLHPDQAFFADIPKLRLASDFEIYKSLGKKVELREDEYSGASRLSVENQWKMISKLRRDGKLLDNARRREMEHTRVEEAMLVLRDDTSSVQVYLALMSRNLLGLAFDPAVEDRENNEETDSLRKVTRASVERMSRMAPQLYESYGKYSRIAYMGFPIESAIEDVMRQAPRHAADIRDAFAPVLSQREVDGTNEEVEPFLTAEEKVKIGRLKNILGRFHLEERSPFLVRFIKKQWKVVRLIPEPTDKLALYLMLKHADNSHLPLDQRPFLNGAADALNDIFKFKLHGKSVRDLDGLLQGADFGVLLKVFEINHMAAKDGRDLKSYMAHYLKAKDETAGRAVLLDCVSHIELTEGQINGFIFQQSRRLLKSDPEAYEKFARRIAGSNLDDPTLYPSYMLKKFFQDENLHAITEFASFVLVEDMASDVINLMIESTAPNGPKPYGRREIVQEAALDLNHRQAIIDMQADAALTDGDVNRVAVSDSLLPFVKEIFNRIPTRIGNGIAARLHPVLLSQIEHLLHQRSSHIREIFVSPEVLSQQKLMDDPLIRDSDRTGVPGPFYERAFIVLKFWQPGSWPLMQAEREAYLASVNERLGAEAVENLLNKIGDLSYLVRSTGVKMRVIAEREKDGKDQLESLRPPASSNTGWFLESEGARTAHGHYGRRSLFEAA